MIRLLAAVLVGAALLAGCDAAEPSRQPPPAPAESMSVTLPWPAPYPGGVEALQERVDGGAQPWLLDPAQVATSFGTAAYGWTDARAVVGGGAGRVDTTSLAVELHGPDDEVVDLELAQPGRTGIGGIWVVTAADGP